MLAARWPAYLGAGAAAGAWLLSIAAAAH